MLSWIAHAFDGVALVAALLALVLLVVVRQLREVTRRRDLAALAAILAAGIALRVWLSPAAPLGAWNYSRFLPLAKVLAGSPVLAQLLGHVWLQDMIFTTNLAIACCMPLLVFAHGRLFWRDDTVALAAAALLAVLPLHLRFARGDDFFIQLIALNSLTACLVHLALEDPARAIRRAALVATPVVAIATFATRPLGFVFGGFLAAVPWVLYGEEIPRPRKRIVTALVIAAVAYDLIAHIFVEYSNVVREAFSFKTVRHATWAFFTPVFNPLLNTSEAPPAIVALAIFAFIVLRRRGDSTRAWFLVLWAASFFVSVAVVQTPVAAFQSRYHQHLIEPLVILAGFGAVAVLRRWRWLGVSVAGLVLLSPLLHRDFIEDVDYATMRELAFVKALRDQGIVPRECTILEYTGVPDRQHDGSRWLRLGARVENGAPTYWWRVVETGGSFDGPDPVAADARRVLRDPPACLMLYEGLACYGVKRVEDSIAAPCAALRRELRTTEVAATDIPNRAYDYNQSLGFLAGGINDIHSDGRIDNAPPALHLRLLRVEGAAG